MRIGAAALLVLLASSARAVQYETEIDISSEQDLYDLYARGEISDETLETLLELLGDGVDINRAGRDELYQLPNVTLGQVDALLEYRKATGRIEDPVELVQAEILSPKLLEQIAPFIVLDVPRANQLAGSVRLLSAYSPTDIYAPPAALQMTAKGPYDLKAAFSLVGVRTYLGAVSYDPIRDALVAGALRYGPQLPKLYVQWKSTRRQLVAGTFLAGFGQGLTLDNTSREMPDGFYPDNTLYLRFIDLTSACRLSSSSEVSDPCPAEIDDLYVTRDIQWREGFRGLAGSIEELELSGEARLSLHAFASYNARSIYQYAIYDRGKCDDPRSDDDASCSAPAVYTQASPPASRWSFSTLRGIYDELAAGGNGTFRLSPRSRLGVTGYYAAPLWRVGGIGLDFQEWARYPFGGPFGAVGLDGATRLGPIDVYFEAARSFDSIPGGGGGFGVLERSVWSVRRQEVELSLRYYDRAFVNPYARSIAASDVFEGQYARNEAGARLSYLGRPSDDWSARFWLDLWTWPQDGDAAGTAGRTNLYTRARADFLGFSFVKLAAWVDYRNKDLARNGRGQCYGVIGRGRSTVDAGGQISDDVDAFGNPLPCSGEFILVAGKVRLEPFGPKVALTLQAQRELVDDARYSDRFRQDSTLWAELEGRPWGWLRLRLRSRYLDEAIDDDNYLERSLWTYLVVGVAPSRKLNAQLRYDVFAWLDQRTSSQNRIPNPEHRFLVELESRF